MGGDIEEFYYKWDLSCILTEQLYRQEENRAIFYNNREKNEVKCREETSAEWSTIGVFFAEEEEEEEEEAHDNQARPSQLGNVEVVESKVVDLKQIVNALNAEIGGTQRMTQLAQQNANNNTTNTKRGNLYIREKGTFVTSFVERYFVLEGNKLSWYDDEAHVGNKVRGALVLNQASKAAVYSDADEDAFKGFRVTGEGDDIILQAPRYMAMKAWINAVGKSVKELTGATHTEVLETMTEAALKQVVKLTNAQKKLEQIIFYFTKHWPYCKIVIFSCLQLSWLFIIIG